MHILQTVYSQFYQHGKTANQTYEGEASLLVDSGRIDHLQNIEGSPPKYRTNRSR
jgi:hypothetical protein